MTAVNRLSSIRTQELQQQALSEQQLQRRIQLHTSDSMETVRSLRTDSGQIALPQSDPAQAESLRALYSNATPEQQRALAQVSADLATALSAPDMAASSSGMAGVISHAAEQYIITTGETNLEQVTTGTMQLALDGADQDVYDLAAELKGCLDEAKTIREYVSDARSELADWPAGEKRDFTWIERDENGKLVERSGNMTREEAEAKLEKMEMELTNVADVKQDFQLRLQDAMQKQQQVMQTLSNIMKSFHDTAKAILQNMKA